MHSTNLCSGATIQVMTDSDNVRTYALSTYIYPARQQGKAQVTIVAGDVARALGLSKRLPLVCGALGTKKFRTECNLRLLSRTGPGQGATTTFTVSV
jgi:hypothetical protein